MLAIERRKQILNRMQVEGGVSVREQAGRFGVSEETIRRDLERLEQEGFAVRSYGGAVLKGDGRGGSRETNAGDETAFGTAVGQILAEGIRDGEHLFLVPDTATQAIVRELRRAGRKNLTIITNAVDVLVECADANDWEVVSLGGTLQSGKAILAGPQTIEWIGRYHADKAVICCGALDRKRGVTDGGILSAEIKRTMLENAAERIVAVEGRNFDRIGFAGVCGADAMDTIVTDAAPSADWQEYFAAKGIVCRYP